MNPNTPTQSLPTLWMALSVLMASTLWAQSEDAAQPDSMSPETVQQLNNIGVQMHRLGSWDDQADWIDGMLNNLWEKNHWNDEPDRFAKNLMSRVSRVPPWRFGERVSTMTNVLGERYRLKPQQRAKFQSLFYQKSFELFTRNAQVILKQTSEFVASRAAGRPFDADQVARWTQESEGLLADVLRCTDEMVESMKSDMDEDQRTLLERDYQSFDRRMDDIIKQRARWAKGDWKPEEWGLQDDPIQMGDAKTAKPHTRPTALREIQPAIGESRTPAGNVMATVEIYRAEDETTWAQWVRKFTAQYELDPGQRTAVQSILAELESRAAQYQQTHAETLSQVKPADRAESDAFEPIRSMFEELQSRARALLTETQRDSDN